MLADVDNFKLYNDMHCHQQGDECLRAVAGALGENNLRPADLPARYGGEEFAMIMPETNQKGARKVAERLRDTLGGLRLNHGAPGAGPFVTLSIGIATQTPSESDCPDWFVKQADQALYAAKHSGRDRVVSADKVLAAFAQTGRERDRQTAVEGSTSRRRVR